MANIQEQKGDPQQLFIYVRCKNKIGKVTKLWLTREIRDSIRSKEEAYKLAKKNNRPENWEQFRIQQRRTKGLITKGKISLRGI